MSQTKLDAPYHSDLNWVKQNHPLMIMASRKRFRLLNHPAVLAVIRHKWGVGRLFYFLFLLYYALFLTFVTAYMVAATAPYTVEQRYPVNIRLALQLERVYMYRDNVRISVLSPSL